MEMDLEIARLQREQWELAEQEERQKELDLYDPKKRITYTVDELAEGIRKGKQYVYTLKMEFEPRIFLQGRLKMPFILDFFEVIEEKQDYLLLVSDKRNVSISVSCIPGEKVEKSLKEWAVQSCEMLRGMKLSAKLDQVKALELIEYFTYELPTAEGRVYNAVFRFVKEGYIFAGAMNCAAEEKKGMGLLLEALIRVTDELNGQEGE